MRHTLRPAANSTPLDYPWQEASATMTARVATWRMETEEDFDATRWLDRLLIKLCQRFGEYRRDEASSFQLHPHLSYFPQFMFNLRRS